MRIITGKAKGLKLKTPRGLSTRPTSDRIKESIFNILNGLIDFDGKTVLDLFAGTGALGIESLSRGAAHSVFIDNETTQIIKYNVLRANFDKDAEIIRGDVIKIINRLATNNRQFDIIFCDPPYNKGLWQNTLTAIDTLNLLSNEGILIVEHGADESFEAKLNHLELMRQIKYGHTTCVEMLKLKTNI